MLNPAGWPAIQSDLIARAIVKTNSNPIQHTCISEPASSAESVARLDYERLRALCAEVEPLGLHADDGLATQAEPACNRDRCRRVERQLVQYLMSTLTLLAGRLRAARLLTRIALQDTALDRPRTRHSQQVNGRVHATRTISTPIRAAAQRCACFREYCYRNVRSCPQDARDSRCQAGAMQKISLRDNSAVSLCLSVGAARQVSLGDERADARPRQACTRAAPWTIQTPHLRGARSSFRASVSQAAGDERLLCRHTPGALPAKSWLPQQQPRNRPRPR